jgi:hypothetical protein
MLKKQNTLATQHKLELNFHGPFFRGLEDKFYQGQNFFLTCIFQKCFWGVGSIDYGNQLVQKQWNIVVHFIS